MNYQTKQMINGCNHCMADTRKKYITEYHHEQGLTSTGGKALDLQELMAYLRSLAPCAERSIAEFPEGKITRVIIWDYTQEDK